MEESLFEWSEGADTATSAGEDLPGADMPLAARLRPRSLSEYIGQEHLLGAGCLVLLVTLCEAVKMYRREIIVTEDKFVFKQGVFKVTSVMLPLVEIRYIDVHQNLIQIALGYGKIRVITDGETPFVIKGLVRPEKFARKVMKQSGSMRGQALRPQFSLSAKTR